MKAEKPYILVLAALPEQLEVINCTKQEILSISVTSEQEARKRVTHLQDGKRITAA